MSAVSPGVGVRGYEYLLKFLLVGDSDVGKGDILDLLPEDALPEQHFCNHHAVVWPKTTYILLEGKRVKLQLWGAQGILVVYDITNRWSFDGITRWLKEIDEQAPGIPKILIGNRLHLEFRRQVLREDAENFAKKKGMEYFEVSTLASFNIQESLTELSRHVLTRNGMERLWRSNRVVSLQESCCRCIVRHLNTVHDMDRLPLPPSLQLEIRSFADTSQLTASNATLPRSGRGHRRSRSDMSLGSPCAGGSLSAGALKRTMLAQFRKLSHVRTPPRVIFSQGPHSNSSRDLNGGESATRSVSVVESASCVNHSSSGNGSETPTHHHRLPIVTRRRNGSRLQQLAREEVEGFESQDSRQNCGIM